MSREKSINIKKIFKVVIAFILSMIMLFLGGYWFQDKVVSCKGQNCTFYAIVEGGGGKIISKMGDNVYDYSPVKVSNKRETSESTIIFTAIPDAGYRVKEWTYNGRVEKRYEGSEGSVYKENMLKIHVGIKRFYKRVITVKFEKIEQGDMI